MEKGEESLLARAWLGDRAEKTIDIQYFIWSVDNIGILASEALVRAADRGVRVRILVDDFGANAPPQNILLMASHPRIDVRIYNPQTKTGITWLKRLWNLLQNFRGVNQRMHDKTFIVDGIVAITGGRNMADEYFDYDQKYNFRDRDILVLGPVVGDMEKNFDSFWGSSLSVPVENILKAPKEKYDFAQLHAYANNRANFSEEVRAALANLPQKFSALTKEIAWGNVRFVHDRPGKNDGWSQGSESTRALAQVLKGAEERVVIQSPYLVLTDNAFALFSDLVKRGVKVSINTNSLPSTDNMFAFSGYSKQRKKILAAGIDVYEYKPYPVVQQKLFERYAQVNSSPPVFAIHAKTFVVDGKTLYVGTFNLDPRSAHLNTEVGILMSDPKIAGKVEQEILTDMRPENSWNARLDNPDQYAPRKKRIKIFLRKLLPITPLL